jgi:phosphoribosylformylglycinamidine (FGAM) synthase-like amidotransferase family enzyme
MPKPATKQVIVENLEGLSVVAGICNQRRNVAGFMADPERACEPPLGSDDGKWIFESVFAALEKKSAAKAA